MSSVLGLLSLLAAFMFWDLAHSARTSDETDSHGWPGCSLEDDSTLTLALFGLTGDGKSSTCRWLAAKEDGCKVGHGLNSETSRVSVVTQPWVGDERCGSLTTIDTPGIQDTKGRDAEQWTLTVEEMKQRFRDLDAVILVVNFAQPRMREERRQMLEVLRSSCGTDLWGHFAVLFTHFSLKTEKNIGGSTPEELSEAAANWRKYFKNMEIERKVKGRYMWQGQKRAMMLQTMESIPFFGVDFSPRTPLAKASEVDEDHREFMGLSEILRMRDWMKKSREEKGSLDLKDLRPRMGPSEAFPEQEWRCTFTQRCVIKVAGDRLTDHDHLRVYPETVECGEKVDDTMFLSAEEKAALDSKAFELVPKIKMPLDYMTRRTDEGSEEIQSFDLGIGQVAGIYRICYCEYGKCDQASRFSQDAGILKVYRPSCGQIQCPDNVAEVAIEGGTPVPCMMQDMPELLFPGKVSFFCRPDFISFHQQDHFDGSCNIDGQFMLESTKEGRMDSCHEAPKVDAARLFKWQTIYANGKREFKCCISSLNTNDGRIVEIFRTEEEEDKMPKSRKVSCKRNRIGCGCMFGDTWHSYNKKHKKLQSTCWVKLNQISSIIGRTPTEILTAIAAAGEPPPEVVKDNKALKIATGAVVAGVAGVAVKTLI